MFRGLAQTSDSAVTGTAAWLASACASLSKHSVFGPILDDPDALHFASAISSDASELLAKFDDPRTCDAFVEEQIAATGGAFTVVAYRKPEMLRLTCEALDASGARQLVVLGVGCDTLPLRLARLGRTPDTFEIDRPGVVEFRERVKARIALDLRHVHGIGVDFEREDFGEKLLAHGYDPTARTVFFAEGLLGYLHREAIDAIFGFIGQNAAAGSRFVFSFTENRTAAAPDRVPNSAAIERQGETLSFDLCPADAPAFVAAQGLRLIQLHTAQELREIYRQRHDGRIHILPFMHLAVAET